MVPSRQPTIYKIGKITKGQKPFKHMDLMLKDQPYKYWRHNQTIQRYSVYNIITAFIHQGIKTITMPGIV
ncbi:hypothetical protein Niako_1238 [Niastella koreensis GR20-10]|uniref:Uncharacterized protein n=1 Tax=Niastella koreensis (strain DSM 17620 / KACC 11465 / NBRC 106392 / GR20-10) TaxID=700598 RepID=G8TKF6_NIAKG|nr:hypothetical protein Niako_1238 [Niastella koreensis GR20-10]